MSRLTTDTIRAHVGRTEVVARPNLGPVTIRSFVTFGAFRSWEPIDVDPEAALRTFLEALIVTDRRSVPRSRSP